MQHQKGFTIIELIVVIAIIAVLATIVLVNVTQYINKGKDAAIKGNMNTILLNSAIYFDQAGSYSEFTTSPGYTVPAGAITNAGATVEGYENANQGFCAFTTLLAGNHFCVDSTGFKGDKVCDPTTFACVLYTLPEA